MTRLNYCLPKASRNIRADVPEQRAALPSTCPDIERTEDRKRRARTLDNVAWNNLEDIVRIIAPRWGKRHRWESSVTISKADSGKAGRLTDISLRTVQKLFSRTGGSLK